MTPPLVRLVGIRKRYGAVEALKGVDLDVRAGEVVAVCGDNGAGKSSLIRVVSGAHEPSGGHIEIEGRRVRFGSPLEALKTGVATIYQDLALAPRQPIWQNIFVGAELTRTLLPGLAVLDKRKMRAESRQYLARLKIAMADTRRTVDTLVGRPAPGRGDRPRAALERKAGDHGRADRGAGRGGKPPGAGPDP